MLPSEMRIFFATAIVIVIGLGVHSAAVANPIWSKSGVRLPAGCEASRDVQLVQSPRGHTVVEVHCGGRHASGKIMLRVRTQTKAPVDALLDTPEGSIWRPEEVVWAPDASAFIINGSENAYAGFDFVVVDIRRVPIVAVSVTAAAQRDMVASYPPCRAAAVEPDDCRRITAHPEFNMSAIAWTRGAKAVVIFAEVPCSSSYGGIMCQVMGYELEVATGRILSRMTPRELKRRFQSRMAWPMRIPDAPVYKSQEKRALPSPETGRLTR